MNKIINIIFYIFVIIVLALSLRGLPGNPNEITLNQSTWRDDGPFELSPERGRFALIYSIVEDDSLQFSNNIGRFAMPDVGISEGSYVSLFAPLLSYVSIPGYIIGKFLGNSQAGAFSIVALFAFLNYLLIRAISIRLGANHVAAMFGALAFLFATPAFTYAVNLYQHHLTTFLVLLSIWALLKPTKIWSMVLIFFLCALAIPLDYPNIFIMAPIGIFELKQIIHLKVIKNTLLIRSSPAKILTPLIIIIPLLFFFWFNQVSYGNPLQLSGTLPSGWDLSRQNNLATNIRLEDLFPTSKQNLQKENTKINNDILNLNPYLPQITEPSDHLQSILTTNTNLQALFPSANQAIKTGSKEAMGFFKTRNLLNGFYIHFLSPDRGIIYYAPLALLGFLGAFLAYKRKVKMVPLLLAIILMNIVIYSLWGDPWGGWAFGSRYLIPCYAILFVFIALLLSYLRKNILFLILFLLLFAYSIAVNSLGALTSAIPPQVEILKLEKVSGKVQKYTYERSWNYLQNGNSKSFIYNAFVKKYFSPIQYYEIMASLIFILGLTSTILLLIQKKKYE